MCLNPFLLPFFVDTMFSAFSLCIHRCPIHSLSFFFPTHRSCHVWWLLHFFLVFKILFPHTSHTYIRRKSNIEFIRWEHIVDTSYGVNCATSRKLRIFTATILYARNSVEGIVHSTSAEDLRDFSDVSMECAPQELIPAEFIVFLSFCMPNS